MQVAIPILLSSLTGLLVPVLNAGILARDASTNLYVLGIFLPISFLQSSLYECLRVASVAFAARASGSCNIHELRHLLHALLTLGPAIFVGLSLAFWVARQPFMAAYDVPPDEHAIASTFIVLNLLVGALVVMSINMMSALYGLGLAYPVSFVTMAGFVLTVGLTAVLVAYTHLGLFSLIVSLRSSADEGRWVGRALTGYGGWSPTGATSTP